MMLACATDPGWAGGVGVWGTPAIDSGLAVAPTGTELPLPVALIWPEAKPGAAMVAEVLKLYGMVPPSGPIAAPGFASGQISATGNGSSVPVGATANPESMAGVPQTPTPPAQPGSVAQANIIAARTSGAPQRG